MDLHAYHKISTALSNNLKRTSLQVDINQEFWFLKIATSESCSMWSFTCPALENVGHELSSCSAEIVVRLFLESWEEETHLMDHHVEQHNNSAGYFFNRKKKVKMS